jgi:hypothetical protein
LLGIKSLDLQRKKTVPTPKADIKPEMDDRRAEAMVTNWLKDIADAQKREKKYRAMAQKCVALYEAKDADATPFAILYSNTETLLPAVYNTRPIPIVQRRYKDADPSGKAVSEVSTRMLKFLIDTEGRDYDTFDDLMQPAVLDALVTNRGLTRFRYMPQESQLPECVYGEAVRWDKFFHGYTRTWKKVPWIGFEWDMSKEELKKNFPKANFGDLRRMVATDEAEDSTEKAEDRDELAGVRTYKVYEIWDKMSGKVIFLSPCSPKAPLRYVDDPLGLSGFFPIPKPLNFMRKITTLVPTPLYEQYRQQAQELNEITRRLKAIIKAIKFRGAYNSTVDGIEKMLNADDNELVPVENVQSMPDGTGMDKLLWTVPTAELAATAQSLYQQREAVKQVIYEITGISDILRGASVASETATAQNIKNQWGTLRLKRMQKEVQRYCRDALSIMLEIAAAKFEIQTMKQMTGLPYFTNDEKKQVTAKIQEMETRAAFAAQVAQPSGQGQQAGAPPEAPQVPPEVQAMLQAPSWEDIEAILQNDVSLHYKTDIETNSTIDAEAAQDKQDISELLNAVSQFLNGVAPLVEQGILPVEVAKSMLLVVSRRFNFGSQLEDALNAMKAPEPKTDPAADAKAEAVKAQAAADKAKSEQDLRKLALDAQLEQQEFQNKQKLMILEAQIAEQELEIKREELRIQQAGLQAKAALQKAQHDMKMEALHAKPKETADASV